MLTTGSNTVCCEQMVSGKEKSNLPILCILHVFLRFVMMQLCQSTVSARYAVQARPICPGLCFGPQAPLSGHLFHPRAASGLQEEVYLRKPADLAALRLQPGRSDPVAAAIYRRLEACLVPRHHRLHQADLALVSENSAMSPTCWVQLELSCLSTRSLKSLVCIPLSIQ